MKRFLGLSCLIFGFTVGLYAQAVDVAVCDVVKNPAPFNGKMVRIKGTVFAGFDEFAIKDATDPNCGYQVNAIWLSYPPGTKGKAGPAAMLVVQPARNFSGKPAPAPAAVTLQKDKEFKQFDSLLAQQRQKGAAMCLGCTRYEVTATLVGRLDTVADAALKIEGGKVTGLGGFGNMNAYPARLMLESVADVTPKEIDFSKIDDETKNSQAQAPGSVEDLNSLVAATQKFAAGLPASPAKDELVKATGIYGKQGEHTAVSASTGNPLEAAAKNEEVGTKDSPDGALFNCIFNSDRLQGDALARAVFHMGQHVYDLQNPGDASGVPFILEYNAWVVTTVSVVTTGQKYLALPGGYMIWDGAWSDADRNTKMDATLKDFLANEAQLSR